MCAHARRSKGVGGYLAGYIPRGVYTPRGVYPAGHIPRGVKTARGIYPAEYIARGYKRPRGIYPAGYIPHGVYSPRGIYISHDMDEYGMSYGTANPSNVLCILSKWKIWRGQQFKSAVYIV